MNRPLAAPRVAVFTDKLDWHVDHTLAAFRALGATPVAVRLSACRIDTTRPHGLAIPGFRDLPDLAIVRAIGDGSLEAITMRLGVLHALEALGTPLLNGARAIERCTDKSMASFLLARAGVPAPETFATQSLAQAREIARRECARGPLVMKPLFGAQGWGLRIVETPGDIPSLEEARGVFYLQRFVGPLRPPYEDMRILVSRGEVVAAMKRRSSHWITNVRQGAKPLAVAPTKEERDMALAASEAMGTVFAGVDLIIGGDGRTMVLEVNSMPGWSGLQRVAPFDIAGRLAADALASIPLPAGGEREEMVARAFVAACEAELAAPKPGNVHHFAPGHGMAAQDFIESARAAAPHIAAPGARVGARIRAAVDATWAAVGQNTNLGIVLLCAPLAQAALGARGADLARETARVLAALDIADAAAAFRAIARANPAGLGSATQHDVTAPAAATLLEAMREAAARDRIAYQYAHDFADVFGLGLAALRRARALGHDAPRATLDVYMAFLGAFPDSHVARKYGLDTACAVRDEAARIGAEIAAADAAGAFALALEFDRNLKARRINPGTSADMTVAVLFADSLMRILASAHKNG